MGAANSKPKAKPKLKWVGGTDAQGRATGDGLLYDLRITEVGGVQVMCMIVLVSDNI
jgi:hypothetical protein